MRFILAVAFALALAPAQAQVLDQPGSSTPAAGNSRMDQTLSPDFAPWGQEYPNGAGPVTGQGGQSSAGGGSFCTSSYGGMGLLGATATQCVYVSNWTQGSCPCGGFTQSRNVHSVDLGTGARSDGQENQGACDACPPPPPIDTNAHCTISGGCTYGFTR